MVRPETKAHAPKHRTAVLHTAVVDSKTHGIGHRRRPVRLDAQTKPTANMHVSLTEPHSRRNNFGILLLVELVQLLHAFQ